MLLDSLERRMLQAFLNGCSARFLMYFGQVGRQSLSSELIQKCKKEVEFLGEKEIEIIYEKIIKGECDRIGQRSEQLSPMKAGFTEVKQEQLSPMKVGEGPEVEITYEKIIKDEYGKILVKQEPLSLAGQEQHLADSGKSKEEDRKMVNFTRSSYFRVLEWF